MARKKAPTLFAGDLLDDRVELTIGELCRACGLPAESVRDLVDQGAIDPVVGRNPGSWRFNGPSVRRVQIAVRVQRDLGVNMAGVALVLDLLEEIDELRVRLGRFER